MALYEGKEYPLCINIQRRAIPLVERAAALGLAETKRLLPPIRAALSNESNQSTCENAP